MQISDLQGMAKAAVCTYAGSQMKTLQGTWVQAEPEGHECLAKWAGELYIYTPEA